MSIDWDGLLYDSLFSTLGVAAVLEAGSGSYSVTVIDQTSGVQIAASEVDVPDILPVALIRADEMAGKNISEDSLLKATLTIRGKTWTIDNVAAKPGPDGAGTGEFTLILIGDE